MTNKEEMNFDIKEMTYFHFFKFTILLFINLLGTFLPNTITLLLLKRSNDDIASAIIGFGNSYYGFSFGPSY